MPKSQIVEPTKERQAGSIPFAEVPLNQYQNDLAKEKETYGEEALLGIYEDMLLIREFESMLQSIKTQGSYEGLSMITRAPLTCLSDRRPLLSGRRFFWMWMIIFSDLTDHTGKSLPRGCQPFVS
jgi:2-oxoisovalerate dehydrogenase E1 component